MNEVRVAEGFLIPLGGPEAAKPLIDWFWKTFRGNSYQPMAEWTEIRIAELRALVSSIACWWTVRDGTQDERRFLQLDEARMMECIEGWVPVQTPYGPGILLFENSD